MKTNKILKSAVILVLLGLFVSVSVTQFTTTAFFGLTGANGYVKNSSNNQPINNALVTLIVYGEVEDIDYTSSTGFYSVNVRLLLLGPIPATLKVEKSGFTTVYESITLQPRQMIQVNIFMTPPPPPPAPYPVTYAGTVKDNYNNIVPEATVQFLENGDVEVTVTAGTDGYYEIDFDILETRSYQLIASKDGYETTIKDAPIIDEGETHYENFYMFNYPQKYAVIACIEDYENPNQAFRNYYAYKDSNRWYHRFVDSYEDGGYNYDSDNVIVLSDVDNKALYQGWTGYAYEGIITLYLENFVSKADCNDIIAFVFSGCAYNIMDGDDVVNTFLCTLEYHEDTGGYLYDYELAAIFDQSQAATNFIFLDVSHAGGFIEEIQGMASYDATFFIGACDTLGQKHWDYSSYWDVGDGSLWTFWFLQAYPFDGGAPPEGAVRSIFSLYDDGRYQWLLYVNSNLLGVYPPITVGYIPEEDKPVLTRMYDDLYLDLDWMYYL